MMPPTYKDLWKGSFQDMKKDAEGQGNGWMYEADPFLAYKNHEAAKEAAVKKKEEAQKQKAKAQAEAAATPGGIAPGSRTKGWNRAPKIEMGKRIRLEIERLVRSGVAWNPYSLQLSTQDRTRIIDEITKLGFRRSHVEEAVEICKDREEVLEWLLIHVPEDDLPAWSLPEGYTAGISMASGNLVREAALERLAATGYSLELCEEALELQRDEAKAAEHLQSSLLRVTADSLAEHLETATLKDLSESDDIWNDEQAVLSSIYDDRYSQQSPKICHINLEVRTLAGNPISVRFQKPSGQYPHALPVISVIAKLPSYIRLSIVRLALLHARGNLLGEQMIFNMVDWLEQEIPRIEAAPGRLVDVSSAISAADTGAHTSDVRTRNKARRKPNPIRWDAGSQKSQEMLSQWQEKQQKPAQQRMLQARQGLPAWRLRDDIVKSVQEHQVVIISGETGSGKSTQSVQFILDDMIARKLGDAANIICTQPRRISALGLADRVSDERCSHVGEEVGYSIRGESRLTTGVTKITFVTTGVLLRRLQTAGGTTKDVVDSLADVSHVVVDEVHERSLDTDFLLVLLRDVLKQRRDLKLVLMSATLDADMFVKYFKTVGPVGRIEIEGRTHPVRDVYLDDVIRLTGFNGYGAEDSEGGQSNESMEGALQGVGMKINYGLIAETVRAIDQELGGQDGGILIFLPGTMEIDRTLQALRQFSHLHALPLHASLLPAEQRRVFPPAPKGMRKVIASTNVAETSITIEDIVAVVDTGRVKETNFDPQNSIVKLEEVWASRAACKQRRGRAGRVRAGTCYKLYTRNAEMNRMAERPDPEIRRVPLEQLCLSVKAMGVKDVPAFLAGALTPPDSLAVGGAIELLRRMGALDGDELTALGRHLSMIPADLRCGKLLVYGATFGCLEASLSIASILTVRSPFMSPQAKREESKAARAPFGQGNGDLVADLRAYEQWSQLRSKGVSAREIRGWCEEHFLSSQTLNDISSNRSQYLSSLKDVGFVPIKYDGRDIGAGPASFYNRSNSNTSLIRAIIAGSFNPQLARIEFPEKKYAAGIAGTVELDPEARTIKYFDQDNCRVFVHPSSTLFDAQGFPSGSAFMGYFTKMATSKVFIRQLTRKYAHVKSTEIKGKYPC